MTTHKCLRLWGRGLSEPHECNVSNISRIVICARIWYSFAMMEMKEKSKSGSVAAILQRELAPSVGEWLKRVNLISELTDIPLSDADRSGHLPKLYSDLVSRLRLPKDVRPPISADATAHGQKRREQGYSSAMLIEELRIFQIVTFEHVASSPERTRPETVASRCGGHCRRGGRATHGIRAQLDLEILTMK